MLRWPCVMLSWNLEDHGHVFPESKDLEIRPSETHDSWMRFFINLRLYGLFVQEPGYWMDFRPGTRRLDELLSRDLEAVVSIDMNSPTKDPWTFVSGPEAVYNSEPRKRTAETDRPAISAATKGSSPGEHSRVAGRVAGELGRDKDQLARRARPRCREHDVSRCFSEHGGTLLMSWRSWPEPASRVVDVRNLALAAVELMSTSHGRRGPLSDKSLGLETGGWRQGPRPGGRDPDLGAGTRNLEAGTWKPEAGEISSWNIFPQQFAPYFLVSCLMAGNNMDFFIGLRELHCSIKFLVEFGVGRQLVAWAIKLPCLCTLDSDDLEVDNQKEPPYSYAAPVAILDLSSSKTSVFAPVPLLRLAYLMLLEEPGDWMDFRPGSRRLDELLSRDPEAVSLDMNSPTKDPWTFVSGPEAVYNSEVFYEPGDPEIVSRPGGSFRPGGLVGTRRFLQTRRSCGNPEVPSDPEVVFRTLRSNKDPEVIWEPRGTVLHLPRQDYSRYLFGFLILPLGSWPLSSSYAVFYFCRKSLTGLEGAGVDVMTQVPGLRYFLRLEKQDLDCSMYFTGPRCALGCTWVLGSFDSILRLAQSNSCFMSHTHYRSLQYLALHVICSLPESERVSSSGSTFALYVICSLPETKRVSSSGSTFALYVICSLPESKRVSSSGSTLHYTYFVSLMGVGS
ncbi:hypothetical protein DY000_02015799 [Brassica cretica]|uniref:Uncharacterized protein n=1 Tax=Brassica cretica TaxID=69181 RepID=A0ABQ7D209_BRACR|nr:hypothetical protein DY000_02015799 [Brassica cretica]